MKFKAGQIIKHPIAMDVAFLVTRVRGPYGPNLKCEVTGEWLNMGFVSSWTLNIRAKFRLTKEQLDQWQICLNPTMKCLRYARWR